ncbi:MAG: hypothetical protein ACR652_08185 [Methylocystis sp.]|uniref:hypothetical protein n=1 Tax=Methylocystis sp. TaxID=1911079 RepID=UPI003DA2124D
MSASIHRMLITRRMALLGFAAASAGARGLPARPRAPEPAQSHLPDPIPEPFGLGSLGQHVYGGDAPKPLRDIRSRSRRASS